MSNRSPKSIKLNAVLNAAKEFSTLVLPLVTFPYVTRVLHSEGYGKFTFCASIVNYFLMLAALGINVYAVRESASLRNDRKRYSEFASEVFSLNVISSIISYLFLFVLLVFWKPEHEYKVMICILSAEIISSTLNVDWVFSGNEDYSFLSVRGILAQLAKVILVFAFVKNSTDYILYAALVVLPIAISGFVSFLTARKYADLRIAFSKGIQKHLTPVLILFASNALITVYLNSDVTMLGFFKGDQTVGLYETSAKIYTAVKGLLNAVLLVAVPRLAYFFGKSDMDSFRKLIGSIFKAVIIMVFPAITGLFMISRNVILLAAGEEYLGGVNSLRILSIALLFAVTATVYVAGVLTNLRRDKVIFQVTAISALLNVVLNLFMIPWLGQDGAAITTLIAELLVTVLSMRKCKDVVDWKAVSSVIPRTAAGCIGIALVCIIVSCFSLPLGWDTCIKIAGSAGLYYAINRKQILDWQKNGL